MAAVSASAMACLATLGAHAVAADEPAREFALPMRASVARVHVKVADDRVVVDQDVTLPRGAWNPRALDMFVAFGAPGMPRAVSAQLLPLREGELEAPASARGEALPLTRALRRPSTASPLLGRETMAGVVIRVMPDAWERAFAPSAMAALRVRSVLALPAEDASGLREIVVRLGAVAGVPMVLGRVELVEQRRSVLSRGSEAHESSDKRALRDGRDGPGRVTARLCGASAKADPIPLAVTVKNAADGDTKTRRAAPMGLAPVLAVRHPNQDLCIRF